MWRNYHDVVMSWHAIKAIIQYFQASYNDLSEHHGPGKWNDPDMVRISLFFLFFGFTLYPVHSDMQKELDVKFM